MHAHYGSNHYLFLYKKITHHYNAMLISVLAGRFVAAGSRANTMLVTKALSQDVMVLVFVPLSPIPKESPSLHSNQL